jgi:hypothetical protein
MSNDFYTLTTLGTLAGATGATVAVTNALRAAFGLDPKWLGLLVAECICLGILAAIGANQASDWFIAILNGCVVFTTAAGATSVGGAAAGGRVASGTTGGATPRSGSIPIERQSPSAVKRGFWSPWF